MANKPWRRAVCTSLLSISLTFLLNAAVTAHAAVVPATALPTGWSIQGDELVWTRAKHLPMGGARYEFRAGKRLLGYPVQRGNSLRLRRTTGQSLTDLSVWAGGRRIDVEIVASRIERAPAPDETELPAAVFDPTTPGPHQTQRLRYALPGLAVADFPEPVEVIAEVTTPLGFDEPAPLVLFLHGRHSTCYRDGPDGSASGDWPCPAGWRPVPSHTGYRYIADVLASQGYLVVSISANGINGQDGLFLDGGAFARSQLIRHHLAQWAEWSAHGGDPWEGRFQGRVNMEQVVLVGHSRGGEGVERAAIESYPDDPWTIQGLVLIGPTAFGRQVAAGVHTTVILPFCDGDVSDLQGQQYVDIGRSLTRDRALRTSVMAMGTNHNYYNTEWTPGLSKSPAWDDWFNSGDVQCGELQERRLTPAEQQAVGLAYTAALVDLAVGDDARSLPLLDGTRVKPPSVGRARAFVHAIGGSKRLLYAPGTGIPVTTRALAARECRGYFLAGPFDLRPGCTPDIYFDLTPHWSPMSLGETAPAPTGLRVQWNRERASLKIPLPPMSDAVDAIDFRIAGEPDAPPIEIDVRVHDSAGNATTLGTRPLTLWSYFGPSPLGKVVARQLRARLAGTGVNAASITAIELLPRSPSGRFWLLDVSTWRDSLPASDPIHLPRISVGDFVVTEGDGGTVQLDVPIQIDGDVAQRARLWVQLTDYADFEEPTSGFSLVLEPGVTSATIPFSYQADDVFNPYPKLIQVTLQAQKNAVTADFDGTVLVEEDDPPPALTMDARRVTAAEGTSMAWTFRLSEPLADSAFWSIYFLPPASGLPELDTDDLPASYLEGLGYAPPDPAMPLSDFGLYLSIEIPPGETVTTLTLPIAADGIAEPEERAALVLDGFGDPIVPQPIRFYGVVPEN